MARELLRSRVMRSSLVAVALVLTACGGSVAPGGSSGSSGTSGTSGTSSTNGSDSETGNTSGATGGGGGSLRCTPGAYVFCRCQDRSEGTKLCQDDGKAFGPCACSGPVECPAPPPNPNPPGCPATYSASYVGQTCGTAPLACSYAAAGAPDPDGCPGTAFLSCRIAPGGSRVWYAGP